MGMARIPVAELRVQTQEPGLVRVTANAPARRGGDLREWVQESGMSSRGLVTVGLGLAVVGGLGALVLAPGFFGMVALSSMFTVGGGLAFLGVQKRKGRAQEPKALPPASSATVIAERARRVASLLEHGGDHTFERLLAQLRWTEPALLETLLAMKESGQVLEDLDLETGEWVYRSTVTDFGAVGLGGGMTLADRRARGLHTEAHHS
jgi:hypothetical protein